VSENKTNLIIAVRGYKRVKKEKTANRTDVTALDNLNNKVLLRIIEPLGNECVDTYDVKNMTELIKRDAYDSAILISKKFTDPAVNEMVKQKIEHISDDYMLPFGIEDLYLAIVDCVNNQCMKKCGDLSLVKSDCAEKKSDFCRLRGVADSAKCHFEQGLIGLLKNDLKTALALNK
jgi:hypothetical protein